MQLDGYFNAAGEPAIQLDLGLGPLEVLIDTGFAGWLIVPTGFAIDLSDAFEGFQNFLTATGQTFAAVVYFVEIDWFNERIEVPVAVSQQITEPLLGGQMLSDCLLSIDYYDRTVRIVRRTSKSD
ncbi:MAG: hypothetical protein AABN34_03200 [Acidobacteriota bacterium]